MARSRLYEYFHVEYQPGERLLLQKIDFFILTFCCLSYFMNYVSDIRLRHPLLHAYLPTHMDSPLVAI